MADVKTAKIKSIKCIGEEPVYNMEVKHYHNFSVNGGLIVHNCFDGAGYGLIYNHVNRSSKPQEVKKKKLTDLWKKKG